MREDWGRPGGGLAGLRDGRGRRGADLRANLRPEERAEGIVLAPMDRRIVATGLRVEIPEGYELQLAAAVGAGAGNTG